MKKTEKIDVHVQPADKIEFLAKNTLKKSSQSVKKSTGKVVTGASLVLVLGACDPEIELANRVPGNFNIKEVTPATISVQIEV